MKSSLVGMTVIAIVALCLPPLRMAALTTEPDNVAQPALAEIAAFNRMFEQATRQMDNAATMALWAEDGISLLPSSKPLIGKTAIGAFMNQVMAGIKGATMEKFEMACYDIAVAGDWASEWCTEHQLVHMPDGKPPFDGRGKMLLVLHKGPDGKWLLEREMWNQGGADI